MDELLLPSDRFRSYPLMVQRSSAVANWTITHSLYSNLEFTQMFENFMVHDTVFRVAMRQSGFDLPSEMTSDAWRIPMDESFHSEIVTDLSARGKQRTGIPNQGTCKQVFYQRLQELIVQADPTVRNYVTLFFSAISETLITRTLLDIPRDVRVAEPVHRIMQDHAGNETRHHHFLANFIAIAWPQFWVKAWHIGTMLPELLAAYLDHDPTAVHRTLREVGIPERDAQEIVAQSYLEFTRKSRQLASRVSVSALKHAGVVDESCVEDRFIEFGFIDAAKLGAIEGIN